MTHSAHTTIPYDALQFDYKNGAQIPCPDCDEPTSIDGLARRGCPNCGAPAQTVTIEAAPDATTDGHPTCGVEGCGGRAVATMIAPPRDGETSARCRDCLEYDLGL